MESTKKNGIKQDKFNCPRKWNQLRIMELSEKNKIKQEKWNLMIKIESSEKSRMKLAKIELTDKNMFPLFYATKIQEMNLSEKMEQLQEKFNRARKMESGKKNIIGREKCN